MVQETVRLDGHIIDSLTLSKVLDIINGAGGSYEIEEFVIGRTRDETSHTEITVSAPTQDLLDRILHLIAQHGAALPAEDAVLAAVEQDGVLPEGFYSTTNLPTRVRVEGVWIEVQRPEMDCAIVVQHGAPSTAWTAPMHRVRRGDLVVVGNKGTRVEPARRSEGLSGFRFMSSDASSERHKARMIRVVADCMRSAKRRGMRRLLVGGPAIIHTGAGPHLARLIEGGWIDLLFAGNALATHDLEAALFGTSLGVDLQTGESLAHGHEHHLRAINLTRRHGGIRALVEGGLLRSGVMHACIMKNVPCVLAGSIRDDGPLPEVITDTVAAQDAMRAHIPEVGAALLVASTLHSVAVGNLLPATVPTVCVDSDTATVIKLMDRGSHQVYGLVTDCEYFLKELCQQLGCAERVGSE